MTITTQTKKKRSRSYLQRNTIHCTSTLRGGKMNNTTTQQEKPTQTQVRTGGVAGKIILLSIVLAAIFIGISFGYAVWSTRTVVLNDAIEAQETGVIFDAQKLEFLTEDVQGTLRSLHGTPPLQGLIRANENDGIDEVGLSTEQQWKERLQTIFVSEMNAARIYDQLRFIDETGQEIVRVDDVEGEIFVVSEEKLQNKANRDYFKEASTLLEGQIYASKAELNREGIPPVVSVPYRPVIRYAIAIFDERDNSFEGVLMANVRVNSLLELSGLQSDERSDVYVIDSLGHFILHPDPSKEWGGPGDLGTGTSLYSEFPDLDAIDTSLASGSIHADGYISAHAKVTPVGETPDRAWTAIRRLSEDEVIQTVNQYTVPLFWIAGITFAVLAIVFAIAVRILLRPLREVATTVQAFGQGDLSVRTQVESNDEVGKVAVAFNEMAERMQGLYTNLEDEVQKKTVELNKKIEELEESQVKNEETMSDLRSEKERTDTILESVGEGLLVTDKNGVVLAVNDAFEALLGFSETEAVGRRLSDVIVLEREDGTPLKEEERPFRQALTTGKEVVVEGTDGLVYKRKDDTLLPVGMTVAPIVVRGEVTGLVEVFRDIERERQIDQAKTEFVSLASHQLKAPLASVNWGTRLLLEGNVGELTEDQKELVEDIEEGSERMVDLVNGLLNVSRIELGVLAVEPEIVDLEEIAKGAISDLRPAIQEKELQLEETYDGDIHEYSGDKKLLFIVLQNLISNAVKYTPEKGSIDVSVGSDSGRGVVHFEVKDTGYGIPKEAQEKMFTKMYRADNVRAKDVPGTGLGLYIVKSIVDGEGGKIWFESEEEKGTTFFVELPLSGMQPKEGSRPLEA